MLTHKSSKIKIIFFHNYEFYTKTIINPIKIQDWLYLRILTHVTDLPYRKYASHVMSTFFAHKIHMFPSKIHMVSL